MSGDLDSCLYLRLDRLEYTNEMGTVAIGRKIGGKWICGSTGWVGSAID